MRYQGGKATIARRLVAEVLAPNYQGQTYYEPFVGGLNVALEVARQMRPKRMILSDGSLDLILCYRALMRGWDPPESISESEYRSLRRASPSALRGFAGYFCSWGGKWWGGYAREGNRNPDYCISAASRRLLIQARSVLSRVPSVEFRRRDYLRSRPTTISGFVYCDPGYEDTLKYLNVTPIDYSRFWLEMESWSQSYPVFVSSYKAPNGWLPIWESRKQNHLSKTKSTTEKVYRLK